MYWAYWLLEEDGPTLASAAAPHFSEADCQHIIHPDRKRQWLGARLLLLDMLKKLGIPFRGLCTDSFNKVHASDSAYFLSFSHTGNLCAVALDTTKPVGIDVELPSARMLRVGPRVLTEEEMSHTGHDCVNICRYWCAKEALYKRYGKKSLIFREDIRVAPGEKPGLLLGEVLKEGGGGPARLASHQVEGAVLVHTY